MVSIFFFYDQLKNIRGRVGYATVSNFYKLSMFTVIFIKIL